MAGDGTPKTPYRHKDANNINASARALKDAAVLEGKVTAENVNSAIDDQVAVALFMMEVRGRDLRGRELKTLK